MPLMLFAFSLVTKRICFSVIHREAAVFTKTVLTLTQGFKSADQTEEPQSTLRCSKIGTARHPLTRMEYASFTHIGISEFIIVG